ncbi:FMN-binding protein [bacterium]|nr:FMN-binding protein [bacterium]MBU1994013.1 FMN-binding protein [bacterium]
MKKILTLSILLFALSLSAKVMTSPVDAMKYTYGAESEISKKNILLSAKQASTIEKEAQVQLDTKIFRVFKAQKNQKTLGFGILINKKVRSKNAVVLYFISAESLLKGIEIIAFNEPPEYLPSDNWNKQFINISTHQMLKLSKDISTITGATLSARSITDGSRVAFAFYNEILKDTE